MSGHEFQCDRLKVKPSEPHGSRNREIAFWRVILAGRCLLSLPQLIEDAFAGEKEILTGLRQYHLTR